MDVRRNEGRSRYELVDGDEVVGVADYHRDTRRSTGDADVLVFPHTEIVRHRRGQGLGEILIRAALDDVRTRGATVVPLCWFVAEFLDANSDYADLRAA